MPQLQRVSAPGAAPQVVDWSALFAPTGFVGAVRVTVIAGVIVRLIMDGPPRR